VKRREFVAELSVGGEIVSTSTGYAFNSTVRRSEALVREFARNRGRMFEGDLPSRDGDFYRRAWWSDEICVIALVRPAK
jgi:hypothetical protein